MTFKTTFIVLFLASLCAGINTNSNPEPIYISEPQGISYIA